MKNNKPIKLTAIERRRLNKIRRLLEEAANLYNRFDSPVQDKFLQFHNEDGSLPHCLRWGSQAAEELYNDSESTTNKVVLDDWRNS